MKNKINLKENFQDEKSENDLSEFTDKEVFKGANALYKEHKKENINNNNNIENNKIKNSDILINTGETQFSANISTFVPKVII